MFYLRLDPYEIISPIINKTDGTIIPEKRYISDTLTIYKHHSYSRFYRGVFTKLDDKYQGMKVYTCKTLNCILKLRKSMYEYCGMWFDVYNEEGILHGDWDYNNRK